MNINTDRRTASAQSMNKETVSVNEILDTYREGRKYPRVVMACPVVLSLADDDHTVDATLYDISMTGLQIWIGIKEASVIKIQADNGIQKDVPDLEIRFQLTTDEQVREMFFLAIPLHLKKIHDDYLAIGMQIIKLDKKIAYILGRYIEISLKNG